MTVLFIHARKSTEADTGRAPQGRLDKLREALEHLHCARAALAAAGAGRCTEETRRAIQSAEDEVVELHRPRRRFRLRS